MPPAPFACLRNLLDGITPEAPPVSLAIGAPRHPPPDFVLEALAQHDTRYGEYPPIEGTPELRAAIAAWLARRYDVPPDFQDILPLNGTREGLFMAAQIAAPSHAETRPTMLMPNPFYQLYAAAALAAGCAPVYLTADASSGFLPDLDALDAATLERACGFYFCSPSNPQGAVAGRAYLERLLELAYAHDLVLFVDECYGDIYDDAPPPSMLEILHTRGDRDAPVLVFHSLSKRSNLPGLRAGFCAGGRSVMQRLAALRQLAGPQSPIPAQNAAALAWADEDHVAENRRLYRQKFDAAEAALNGHFGFYRPAGGFFLWLDVGDGEAAAVKLWREAGIRVLPGAYLAHPDSDGRNSAAAYIRVALVGEVEETADALTRMRACLEGADG